MNGAKSRVEKLCQAFENGKDLVELSDLYPHDISNVLKLYLRQVNLLVVLRVERCFIILNTSNSFFDLKTTGVQTFALYYVTVYIISQTGSCVFIYLALFF